MRLIRSLHATHRRGRVVRMAATLLAALGPLWLAAGCDSELVTANHAPPQGANGGADPVAEPRPTVVDAAVTQESGDAAPPTAPGSPSVAASPDAAPSANGAPAGSRYEEKTFDDIKFDIQPDAPFHRKMLTPEIEALVGRQIRIRGYILPTPQKRGIKEFVLVRDNQECCFGPGAALYDCIFVRMRPGQTAEFSIRPVAVSGTFDVREIVGFDGKHLAIYHLDGDAIQ